MSLPPSKIRQAAHVVLVVLFAGVIAAPVLSTVTGLAPGPTLQENRRLAPLPVFRWSRGVILGFPRAYEAYFNDHFPFRDRLVWSYNIVRARWLRVSPQPYVVIGKEGWLYYRQGLLDNNAPVPPFTQAELDRWTRVLEERRQWLAGRGRRFLVVVAPDKHTIYPEYLPGWAKPRANQSRLDQLLEYARAHSAVDFLDLRGPLLEAKARDRVYWKTDTHWNGRGGVVADQCVAQALARWFPQISSDPRCPLAPTAAKAVGGDLAAMMGLALDFPEVENLSYAPTAPYRARPVAYVPDPPLPPDWPEWANPLAAERHDDGLPTAVVFHDSFFGTIRPWLAEHFRRAVFLCQDAFDAAAVERERPDVVVQEFVERKLSYLHPESGVPTAAAAALAGP